MLLDWAQFSRVLSFKDYTVVPTKLLSRDLLTDPIFLTLQAWVKDPTNDEPLSDWMISSNENNKHQININLIAKPLCVDAHSSKETLDNGHEFIYTIYY